MEHSIANILLTFVISIYITHVYCMQMSEAYVGGSTEYLGALTFTSDECLGQPCSLVFSLYVVCLYKGARFDGSTV